MKKVNFVNNMKKALNNSKISIQKSNIAKILQDKNVDKILNYFCSISELERESSFNISFFPNKFSHSKSFYTDEQIIVYWMLLCDYLQVK